MPKGDPRDLWDLRTPKGIQEIAGIPEFQKPQGFGNPKGDPRPLRDSGTPNGIQGPQGFRNSKSLKDLGIPKISEFLTPVGSGIPKRIQQISRNLGIPKISGIRSPKGFGNPKGDPRDLRDSKMPKGIQSENPKFQRGSRAGTNPEFIPKLPPPPPFPNISLPGQNSTMGIFCFVENFSPHFLRGFFLEKGDREEVWKICIEELEQL